jgi:hypothetical protein
MNISGQVYLYGELDTDARDIVGVFDDENVCHGFANITHDAQSTETGLYLTVYDSQVSGRPLNFRLWQYSTGREIVLTTTPAITFQKDAMLGTDQPVRFDGGEDFVQYFRLEEGWNWVSFNVSSKQLDNMAALLTSTPWQNGDILTDMSSDLTLTYHDDSWYANDNPQDMGISSKIAYAIKVQQPTVIPIAGTVIKDKDERTIDLKQGWNGIGYTPITNLPVETALSDYYDSAQPGDVIKSHTEFAYFTKTGNTGRWQGSLKYMKPGEGYMMLRKGKGNASFTYPYYEMGSTFTFETANAPRRPAQARRASEEDSNSGSFARNYRYTMNVCAVVEGYSVEEGDLIVAYADSEPCGVAEVDETYTNHTEPLYLSIGGNKPGNIYFAIERGGDVVALSSEQMTFRANAIVGTPDEPTVIYFADATGIDVVTGDYKQGKWYTINGVQLQQKPTRPGLYIYNNSKVVIKK